MIDLQILIDSTQYTVNQEKLLVLTNKLLSALNLQGQELSLLLVDDKKIQELNKLYRGKDKATDVLSFPQQEWKLPLTLENKESQELSSLSSELLGDIVISLDHAKTSAASLGHSLAREVCFLLIHGILHLCGHDHQVPEEEKLMISQQKKLLKSLEESSDKQTDPLWLDCVLTKKDSQ